MSLHVKEKEKVKENKTKRIRNVICSDSQLLSLRCPLVICYIILLLITSSPLLIGNIVWYFSVSYEAKPKLTLYITRCLRGYVLRVSHSLTQLITKPHVN